MSRAKRELYRDPERGKLGGVCAGLSDYFSMELWLVRIIAVSAVLLSGGPFFVVAYIACWFILDKKPCDKTMSSMHKATEPCDGKPIEVKFKVWQSGEPPRQALQELNVKLSELDNRVQSMEKYVTSPEFTISHEINKL